MCDGIIEVLFRLFAEVRVWNDLFMFCQFAESGVCQPKSSRPPAYVAWAVVIVVMLSKIVGASAYFSVRLLRRGLF